MLHSLFLEQSLDAVLVSGSTNRRYLSGWSADDHAPDRPSGVLMVSPRARQLFTSSTNLPWAEAEARPDVEVRQWSTSWIDSVAADVQNLGMKRIGFEDAITPVAAWRALQDALGTDVELVPVGDTLDRAREVKREDEIESIQHAVAITDEAFRRAADHLRAGMTERSLAAFIDQQFRELHSDGNAFDTIVASGPNAARPHHTPGEREIEPGEPVIIDMGARVNGYCGDLTRTIWVGQADERLGTMYHLVAEAQRAAFAQVKAGNAAFAVDQAARATFDAAGFGNNVLHSVGHSLGLRIHEAPFLNQATTASLVAGNVVTIEPGIYLPDWGGVRIEDVVVVTETGYRNLTLAPKLLGETTSPVGPEHAGDHKGNT